MNLEAAFLKIPNVLIGNGLYKDMDIAFTPKNYEEFSADFNNYLKNNKCIHFYENAMLLGSRRLKSDEFPFHIEKYKKHPEEMMLNCKNVINSSKLYKSNK